MKRIVVIGVVALVTVVQAVAENTTLVDRLLAVMEDTPWGDSDREYYKQNRAAGIYVSFDHVETRAKAALLYAQDKGIPLEEVLGVAKTQIRTSCAIVEANDPQKKSRAETYRKWMQEVLVTSGDLTSLPFLEEMSRGSSNRWIREDSAYAYVRIAGTNALPFIRSLMANHRQDSTLAFQNFLKILKKAPDVTDESLVFLCEFAGQDDNGYAVKLMDEALCEILPGYPTSAQRLTIAGRHIASDFTSAKEYFASAKAEIEKIPETQRKDFRAKGELLDPDRKKEP